MRLDNWVQPTLVDRILDWEEKGDIVRIIGEI